MVPTVDSTTVHLFGEGPQPVPGSCQPAQELRGTHPPACLPLRQNTTLLCTLPPLPSLGDFIIELKKHYDNTQLMLVNPNVEVSAPGARVDGAVGCSACFFTSLAGC